MRARSETPCIESCYSASIDIAMICFNYNKLGYFIFIYPEPCKKNLNKIKGEKSDKLEKRNKSGKKKL
jgi:hypothetical protein